MNHNISLCSYVYVIYHQICVGPRLTWFCAVTFDAICGNWCEKLCWFSLIFTLCETLTPPHYETLTISTLHCEISQPVNPKLLFGQIFQPAYTLKPTKKSMMNLILWSQQWLNSGQFPIDLFTTTQPSSHLILSLSNFTSTLSHQSLKKRFNLQN